MYKHQKVTTYTNQSDGTVKIQADSYYESLAHQLVEIEKQLPTSKQTILKDILTCLELITKDKSIEVNIRIKARDGEPVELTKRWTVVKESFSIR